MRKTALMALLLLTVCRSRIYAQGVSVADGFYAYVPGVRVELLRQEDPASTCQGQFIPLECEVVSMTGVPIPSELSMGMDPAGSLYYTSQTSGDILDTGGSRIGIDGRYVMRERSDGSPERIAVLMRQICADPCPTQHPPTFSYKSPVFDVTNGRIVIEVHAETYNSGGTRIADEVGLIAISGLPTMFDTLLTFTLGGQLSALMPAHPDGFRSADSLQLWTGDVRSLPDWSQAQPLTCNAATSPAPGQIITVADTLPDPPAGHGRYYLSASVKGSDRRLGRQYTNGAFSARDPTSLPVCIP